VSQIALVDEARRAPVRLPPGLARPAVSMRLAWVVSRMITPDPEFPRLGTPNEVDRAEARAVLAAFDGVCRPAGLAQVVAWLDPIAASVSWPPSPKELAMRAGLVCAAAGELPASVFSAGSQLAAMRQFDRFPSVAALMTLLETEGAGLVAQRDALRRVAAWGQLSPEGLARRSAEDAAAKERADDRAAFRAMSPADQKTWRDTLMARLANVERVQQEVERRKRNSEAAPKLSRCAVVGAVQRVNPSLTCLVLDDVDAAMKPQPGSYLVIVHVLFGADVDEALHPKIRAALKAVTPEGVTVHVDVQWVSPPVAERIEAA
jgi:hypothetical protein